MILSYATFDINNYSDLEQREDFKKKNIKSYGIIHQNINTPSYTHNYFFLNPSLLIKFFVKAWHFTIV